ncbi:MAG: PilW family protein [Gammaproteobacteria bacterium]|nr:PilW family protein [Gammaproteobacteria bacterium]
MKTNHTKQLGMSLIEMMIAMTLGLLLIAMVISVFLTSNRNYTQDDTFARLQESGRFAIDRLSSELAMAHFWGGMLNPTTNLVDNTGVAAANKCNTTFDATDPILIIDEATATEVNTAHTCIAASSVSGIGADMLVIKRVSGTNKKDRLPNVPDDNKMMLYTDSNGKNGQLKLYDNSDYAGTGPSASEAGAWEFSPRIFFICLQELDDTDNLVGLTAPALCVAEWSQFKSKIRPRVYVEGIEDFQVTFGIDSDSDGIPDQYVAEPTSTQMISAVTATIKVLARSSNTVPGYVNEKSYDLGKSTGVPYKPNDGYYRRVFSKTVMLRNTAYLRSID